MPGEVADDFLQYLAIRDEQLAARVDAPTQVELAADEESAIAEVGGNVPALVLGALAVGRRMMDELATLDPEDEQGRYDRATTMQRATDFLLGHWEGLRLELRAVLNATSTTAHRIVADRATRLAAEAAERARRTEVRSERGRQMKSRTILGQRTLLRVAESVDDEHGWVVSYSHLMHTIVGDAYRAPGAPKPPGDLFQSIIAPAIRVGLIEMRSSGEFRIIAPDAREREPVRHARGPKRVYISMGEAAVLVTQLHRMRNELAEDGLPVIDEAVVASLTAAADEAQTVRRPLPTAAGMAESRLLVATKATELTTKPRLLWLFAESLGESDPRQQLLDYVEQLPRDGLRLWRGFVGATRAQVTFTEERSVHRGAGPAVDDVRVRRLRDDER